MVKMHPRNIYNARFDFKSLAETYPEFKQHLTLRPNGKVFMNFKDPEALRALAKVLLKKDFNLEIEIPINSLIPTIPLRLNYILFIEDLLNVANIKSDVIGIDIGTGGSCIYPLIATRKNKWKMIGTECNSVNFKYAMSNVVKNNLGESIKVVEVSGETTLKELLEKDNLTYTFSMCNPPFFSGVHELSSQFKARKPDRKEPNNAFCASTHEVVTQGGEVEFVTKIIAESHDFKDRIKIFTSMLGIKKSLQPLIHLLKNSNDVKSFVQTEFFQGHTIRWGLAWTFYDYDLTKVNKPKKPKPKKPFVYSHEYKGTIENIGVQIEKILNELKIEFKIIKKESQSRLYNLTAYFNTWSHNRQRRREAKRMEKIMGGLIPEDQNNTNNEKSFECNSPMETSYEENDQTTSNTIKRKMSESEDDSEEEIDHKKIHSENLNLNTKTNFNKLIEASLYVILKDDNLVIEMTPLTDSTNRNSLHQIVQHVKNHLVLD